MSLVLLDTNLLLLLIVGRADRSYLDFHKRTKTYDSIDLDNVERLIACYDNVVTVPHVLAEASGLLRQVKNPARDRIQHEFRAFVLVCEELTLESAKGCRHEEYLALGLTDAIILTVCETMSVGGRIDLLTADEPIYNRALSLGLGAELYA